MFTFLPITKKTTFYIGVTNNLLRRVLEHKSKAKEGFSSRYNLNKLVYFESTNSQIDAIAREKQLKTVASRMEDKSNKRI